jgi:hypothetical protein
MKVFTAFLLVALCSTVWAEEVDLAQLTLAEIAGSPNAWPELQYNEEGAPDEFKQAEEVALSVLDKLQRYEVSTNLSSEQLASSAEFYAKLAAVFGNSKGYYNLVLADACRRLALSRIGYGLVNSSSEVESFGKSYAKLHPSLIVELEATVIDALNATSEASFSNANLTTVEGMNYIWEELGTSLSKIRYEVAQQPNVANSEQLILNPSGAFLLNNISETDLMLSVHIPGMITFLERGGQLNQIDLSNITEFKETMGDTRTSFSFPALSVKKLYAIHLYALVEMFDSTQDFTTSGVNAIVF